ncbi:MAG: hypothetical protein AAFX50_11105 [Acidobacteriota bacterium]
MPHQLPRGNPTPKNSPIATAALALMLGLTLSAHAVSAQPFVLEIDVGPEQVGTTPTYQVDWGGDVDGLTAYLFAQGCSQKATAGSDGSDWSWTRLSPDDELECYFFGETGVLEMDFETIDRPSPAYGTATRRVSITESRTSSFIARFVAARGHQLRARFGYEGTPWTPWADGELSRSFPIPDAGQSSSIHFDLEMRPDPTSASVAMSGYLKTMKLNSGER